MKFYKNKINGRVLVGNIHVNSELVEIVGPNGKNPNFECIKWNLHSYEEIFNFKLSLKLTHFDTIPKSYDSIKKCICSSIKENNSSYIFLISPNSRRVSFLYKDTFSSNWELQHCAYGDYFSFSKRKKKSAVKEDWITIKK